MKKKLKRLFGYSYSMGGAALIAGASPTPMKAPIVAPMATVTGASIVVKQLRKLKPKKLKRRYR